MDFITWLTMVFTMTYNFLSTNHIGGYTLFDIMLSLFLVGTTLDFVINRGSK